MRLLRVGMVGAERPAALAADGSVRDLSRLATAVDPGNEDLLAEIRDALEDGSLPVVPAGVRIGAPIERPGKVVGIGLNYKDHAAETGAAIPDEPVLFLKAPSAISGPYDPIVLPPGSVATDHEVELGVVVGRTLRQCASPDEALAAVAGYVAANDVTERQYAASGVGWTKGKCCDSFLPLGPWLVTPDEVGDPASLDLSLWVDGSLRQSSSTAMMAYGVGELLAFLSGLMTLEPGDLVLTGTPGGVATGRPDPKPFLRPGQVVELEVARLGRQRTPVV